MSILVATDLSDHSRSAIRWASALAARRNSALYVAHVIDTLGDNELWSALFETPDEIEERVLKNASDQASEFVLETLKGHVAPNERTVLVSVGPPADEIERFAHQKGVEMVVSGTSGHGRLRNAVFGSTAYRLTHTSDRPMVFVPNGAAMPPAKKIVVALDFSDCSDDALAWAATAAQEWGSEVLAVHALGVSALSPDYEPSANFVPMVETLIEQRTEKIEQRLGEHGLKGHVIISRSSPGEAIQEAARDEGAELIVMGTHGRGAVERFFLGSVALRVLRDPPCAVATIHHESEE